MKVAGTLRVPSAVHHWNGNGCPKEFIEIACTSADGTRSVPATFTQSRPLHRRRGDFNFISIRGTAVRRLPESDFHDGEAVPGGNVENQFGDVLRGRGLIHQIERLAQLFEMRKPPDPSRSRNMR